MSFFAEVGNALGVDWAKIAGGYQVVNYNGQAVYVEGVKRLVSIDASKIVVDVGAQTLTVEGENLSVFDIEKNIIMINGKIDGCGVGEREKNAR